MRGLFIGVIVLVTAERAARGLIANRVAKGILGEAGGAASRQSVRGAARAAGQEFAARLTPRDLLAIAAETARGAVRGTT